MFGRSVDLFLCTEGLVQFSEPAFYWVRCLAKMLNSFSLHYLKEITSQQNMSYIDRWDLPKSIFVDRYI